MEKKSRYISTASLLIAFGIFLIFNLRETGNYPQTMHAAVMCKVRAGAGTGFELVGYLQQDEAVVVLGEAWDTDNRIWYRIDPKFLPQDARTWCPADEYYVRSDLLVLD